MCDCKFVGLRQLFLTRKPTTLCTNKIRGKAIRLITWSISNDMLFAVRPISDNRPLYGKQRQLQAYRCESADRGCCILSATVTTGVAPVCALRKGVVTCEIKRF